MIKWIKDVARSIFFDNSTNGFTSTNVQAAIEEAASGDRLPRLREVDMVVYPSHGPVNTFSGLLYEANPVNDTIEFLKEEID